MAQTARVETAKPVDTARNATGNGADVGWFGDGLGHPPKLAAGHPREEAALWLFRGRWGWFRIC